MNEAIAFCLGCIVTAVAIGIYSLPETNTLKEVRHVLDECQLDLPRTQICVLTAKPKESDE